MLEFARTNDRCRKPLDSYAAADAMDAVHLSVDRFCLLAGVEALAMMEEVPRPCAGPAPLGTVEVIWGRTHKIGYHGGKVKVARPRVRGKEVSLEVGRRYAGNLLLEWALNLMVLNVPTRTTARSVCPRATWRKRVATAPRSRPFPGALWRCHARRAWLAISRNSTC